MENSYEEAKEALLFNYNDHVQDQVEKLKEPRNNNGIGNGIPVVVDKNVKVNLNNGFLPSASSAFGGFIRPVNNNFGDDEIRNLVSQSALLLNDDVDFMIDGNTDYNVNVTSSGETGSSGDNGFCCWNAGFTGNEPTDYPMLDIPFPASSASSSSHEETSYYARSWLAENVGNTAHLTVEGNEMNNMIMTPSPKTPESISSGSLEVVRKANRNHNEVERRRRNTLNQRYNELEKVIPKEYMVHKFRNNRKFQRPGTREWTQAALIEAAKDFILLLQAENERLRVIRKRKPVWEEGNIVFKDPSTLNPQ